MVARRRTDQNARVEQATTFVTAGQIGGREVRLKVAMSCCIEVHVDSHVP